MADKRTPDGPPDEGSGGGEGRERDAGHERELRPGERLFYALGQLYRLWWRGQLDVEPIRFDLCDLARIIGVASELEFVSEDRLGVHYHFPGETLVVRERPSTDFPWELLDTWEWAAEQELRAGTEFWD
jgi:hypothetical protein